MLSASLVVVWLVLFTVDANLDTLCYGMLCYGAFCGRCPFAVFYTYFVILCFPSVRFGLLVALRRLIAFAVLLPALALLCIASVCFAFWFAPLCLVVWFFDFDLHVALLCCNALFVVMHCCTVLCPALIRFCFWFAPPAKTGQWDNGPTAQRPEGRFHPFN